jgi:predicted O-methyltransferase YrrM
MATENKLALLNLAARHLGPGETYLEVGAWAGCSILGAALGNPGPFHTIDDFSQFGGPVDDFRRNLETFGRTDVTLHEGDAWGVLADPPFPLPVGVFFYDGGHSFDDQYRAFSRIEPLLADRALVIVDDTAWDWVAAADARFVRGRPEYERLLRFESPENGEPRWWNGMEVYAFRRDPGRPMTAGRLRRRERRHLRLRRIELRARHLGGRTARVARMPGNWLRARWRAR